MKNLSLSSSQIRDVKGSYSHSYPNREERRERETNAGKRRVHFPVFDENGVQVGMKTNFFPKKFNHSRYGNLKGFWNMLNTTKRKN